MSQYYQTSSLPENVKKVKEVMLSATSLVSQVSLFQPQNRFKKCNT